MPLGLVLIVILVILLGGLAAASADTGTASGTAVGDWFRSNILVVLLLMGQP